MRFGPGRRVPARRRRPGPVAPHEQRARRNCASAVPAYLPGVARALVHPPTRTWIGARLRQGDSARINSASVTHSGQISAGWRPNAHAKRSASHSLRDTRAIPRSRCGSRRGNDELLTSAGVAARIRRRSKTPRVIVCRPSKEPGARFSSPARSRSGPNRKGTGGPVAKNGALRCR